MCLSLRVLRQTYYFDCLLQQVLGYDEGGDGHEGNGQSFL
jgi:hypothetical protein